MFEIHEPKEITFDELILPTTSKFILEKNKGKDINKSKFGIGSGTFGNRRDDYEIVMDLL